MPCPANAAPGFPSVVADGYGGVRQEGCAGVEAAALQCGQEKEGEEGGEEEDGGRGIVGG